MTNSSFLNLGTKTATALSVVAMSLSAPAANANPHTASHAIPAGQLSQRWADINSDAIYTIDIGHNTSLTAAAKFNQEFGGAPIAVAMIKGNDTSHFNFSTVAKGTAEIKNTGYGHAMVAEFKQG